jgi:hypothetical protein
MQKQKMGKAKLLIIAALLYPACVLAQIGGGNSGSGAHGSSMGGGTTTGIASDQAHISPPGTNSLGEFSGIIWWRDCRRQYGTERQPADRRRDPGRKRQGRFEDQQYLQRLLKREFGAVGLRMFHRNDLRRFELAGGRGVVPFKRRRWDDIYREEFAWHGFGRGITRDIQHQRIRRDRLSRQRVLARSRAVRLSAWRQGCGA